MKGRGGGAAAAPENAPAGRFRRAQVDRLGRKLAFMRSETYAIGADGRERLIATGSLTKAVTSA